VGAFLGARTDPGPSSLLGQISARPRPPHLQYFRVPLRFQLELLESSDSSGMAPESTGIALESTGIALECSL